MEESDTIDWDSYWRGEVDGGPMEAGASADKLTYLERFLSAVGTPDSFAAVGCGDGTVPEMVASNYPETTLCGYDVAASVIEQNREEFESRDTLSFEVASLPDPAIDRQFEIVYCFATLMYVREIEQAICDLYALVEPGGYLIVNYPNEELCETYAAGIEEGTPLYRRFKLVCNRVNKLSRDRIETLLGTETVDYWAFVDASAAVHEPLSWFPCVFVQKPQ